MLLHIFQQNCVLCSQAAIWAERIFHMPLGSRLTMKRDFWEIYTSVEFWGVDCKLFWKKKKEGKLSYFSARLIFGQTGVSLIWGSAGGKIKGKKALNGANLELPDVREMNGSSICRLQVFSHSHISKVSLCCHQRNTVRAITWKQAHIQSFVTQRVGIDV